MRKLQQKLSVSNCEQIAKLTVFHVSKCNIILCKFVCVAALVSAHSEDIQSRNFECSCGTIFWKMVHLKTKVHIETQAYLVSRLHSVETIGICSFSANIILVKIWNENFETQFCIFKLWIKDKQLLLCIFEKKESKDYKENARDSFSTEKYTFNIPEP